MTGRILSMSKSLPFELAKQLEITELESYIKRVEKEMRQAVEIPNVDMATPISRLLHTPAKRLRPSLVIGVVKAYQRPIDKEVIQACAAVELVHIASLVHDDIIDNAKSRWNMPTVNAVEGDHQAILVGDYLFAKAYQLAATLSQELAEVIGSTIAAICMGESQELADAHNVNRNQTSLKTVMSNKTGSLMAAACHVGGLCARARATELAALGAYGHDFGMAFQMLDDLLDLLSSTSRMGKPVGNDIKEGIYTMAVLLGLKKDKSRQLSTLLNKSPVPLSTIVTYLIDEGCIKTAMATTKTYAIAATKALASTSIGQKSRLYHFPQSYLNWAFDNLVLEKYLSGL